MSNKEDLELLLTTLPQLTNVTRFRIGEVEIEFSPTVVPGTLAPTEPVPTLFQRFAGDTLKQPVDEGESVATVEDE